MTQLFNGTITTAGTIISGTVTGLYDSVVIGASMIFDWGSGGTAGTAYLQTSPNDGTNWFDVAAFSFGSADLNRYASLAIPTFGTGTFAITDGELTGGAITPIPIGDSARVKIVSVGTYAGTTTLKIFLDAKR